ncbi:hypothetical protein C0992_001839 [Termitomyces sp. T32_za158]|nr:hypothetical protein C0992_001839 [Termitomyces sp. T32_za158]
MLGSLLPSAGRTDVSQLLPTVKCSNCNRPVPFSDLSDHVCAAAPTLPKPALSPADALSLLPQRLQDRARTSISNDARLGGTSSSDRIRIDSGSMHQPRLSYPAAPNEADRVPSPYQRSLVTPSPTPSFGSVNPLRTRAGTVAGTIGRRPSNFSATSYNPPPVSSPATARPSFLSSLDAGSSYNSGPLPRQQLPSPPREPSLRASPVPQYSEPDTQTGGAAGMAGVGRRGFAAAARAVMFLPPGDHLRVPQPRRNNAASFLDTDLPRHINETPPLSAGSANSSQSPGVSPYPQSPVGCHGLPYPDRYDPQVHPSHQVIAMDTGLIPSSSPLGKSPFDKDRNQMGSVVPNTNPLIFDQRGLETPLTAKQQSSTPWSLRETDTSIYLHNQSVTTRSVNNDTNTTRPPSSSDSASDYGNGLAYADSTDHEDEEPPADTKTRNKANPPPPLPLHGILRSGSTSSMNHVRFPVSIEPAHQHKSSVSSLSSSGGDDVRKSNSAAIAHALGLSQAASGSYARLGGPGVQMGGRGRSGTSASLSSESNCNAHLRGGPGTNGSSMGTMEKELSILMEERKEERGDGVEERDRMAGLSKSKSTGRQRTLTVGEGQASGAWAPLSAKNPSVSSLTRSELREKENERKLALERKIPTRANSSTENMGGSGRKERTKKPKVCVKCNETIENGRWIATESGSVLCERCWKHMYLPKKSFPDKSFYVFDGKPFCKYHYHEANESLCAATLCGQPIEGPCAVSHTGDRYHPEHMLCEYPGNPPCRTKLAEYWEVDGRMLCERHAHTSEAESDDERGEEDWVQSSKRMKRVTRFIDLAGGLPSGGLR